MSEKGKARSIALNFLLTTSNKANRRHICVLALFLLHLSSYLSHEGVSVNRCTGETLWRRKPVNPCSSAVLRYTGPFLLPLLSFREPELELLYTVASCVPSLLQAQAELREETCA